MLEVIDLYKKYKTKYSQFELNVEMQIQNPSFVVIEGESGSGKSTFAKILAGLIPMNHGLIKLNGKDITSKTENYVEYLEAKEPLIDNFTVYQTLYAKCYHLYNKQEVEGKIENVLTTLKLNNLRDVKIHDLSGGEAQRVAVGCLLLSTKPILVLDEATHSLDENNSEIIVNILKEIKNKTVIYITHKIDEIEGIGDIFYRFDRGKILDIKEINRKTDHLFDLQLYNKTKIFPIVKNSFFTGIKSHIQTSISYLILFFLCSCFLAIGTFCTSINTEATLYDYYAGSDNHFHSDSSIYYVTSTNYYVEVHSSYNRKIYKDDVEELKKKYNAIDAIENEPFYNYTMLPDPNGKYILHLDNYQEKNVIAGRLYRKEKEVVLAINETEFNTNRNYYKSFIGKKYGEYTIVGIVLTAHDVLFRMLFYASKEDFESYKETLENQQEDIFIFYASDVDTKKTIFSLEKEEFLNCFIDNSLPNDTIATSKMTNSKILEIRFSSSQLSMFEQKLNCVSSEHKVSMNQATYDKFIDERMIPCSYFYFNTFKECENFISYLKDENISYSFGYYHYNQNIQLLSYLGAFILIIGFYILVGIINRRFNRNRDLFYNKCNYNKKKQWLANIISSSVLAIISILIYTIVYAGLSQLKYLSIITYYALRWMTVVNGFIMIGIALFLHIGIEMIIQSIPKKRAR